MPDTPENLFAAVGDTEQGDTSLYSDLPAPGDSAIGQKPLPTQSLLMALAKVNTSKNPTLQLSDEAVDQARGIIESGQELSERYKLTADKALKQATSLNILRMDKQRILTPDEGKQIDEAYNNVLAYDQERKARVALEENAVEQIRVMASRDPVQAKVLLDNLQFGGASQVHEDYLTKMTILHQRADELDEEYQNQGWGKTILNFALNLVPTNYNFQRSGIVATDEAGFMDWLKSGEGIRKQSETLWNMSVEDFAEYASRDGELMQSIRSNATTLFGITSDASAAKFILEDLTSQSDDSRTMSNVWGVVDPLTFIPFGKIGSLTKTIARAGARREAVDLLTRAAEVLEKEGPVNMAAKTGVNEDELRAAQSTGHLDPTTSQADAVPAVMDIATREEAARKALEELPGIVREQRLSNPEELMAAFESTQEDIAKNIGRDIKDIKFVRSTDTLATGNELHSVEYTFGKKTGGGYASKRTAEGGASSAGLDGQAFRAEDGQWYVKGKVNVAEQGFFTNPLHEPTQGFISRLTGRFWRSPSRTTDPTLHGKAVLAGSAIGRQQRAVGERLNESFRAIPPKSQEIVSQIALLGQNKKKWWSDNELQSLVRRAYNRDATDLEIKAYKELQLFNDMDWVLRNDQIYLDKSVKGMQSAKFNAKGEDFDLDVRVNYTPTMKPTERVYNASDGIHYTSQRNPLTEKEFQKLVDNGYVLVEPEDAIQLLDGTTVNKLLMRKSDIEVSPLRRTQLAYSEGGHRLYTDNYFVKQARVGVQRDTQTEFLRTPGTFVTAKNIAEAKKWADVMEEARLAVKEGKYTTGLELDEEIFKGNRAFPSGDDFLKGIDEGAISKDHPFEAVFDRELPTAYKSSGVDVTSFTAVDEQGFNGYYRTTGKMYTSHKGEILKDTTGDIATTVDPYEALSTSLRQVTRQSGLFNYKTEALERFVKTYGNDLDVAADLRSPYAKFDGALIKPGTTLERRNAIEAHRASIRNVLGFETEGDKAAREVYRSVAEAALGSGDSVARKFAHDTVWWFKEKNPVSALRGFAFDSKLGMYNFGQFFIQTSTMFSATALSPKMGLKGMMTAVPLHSYLLKKGSENTLDVLAKRGVGKLAGFKTEQEFKEYARYMYKSGFMDMNGSHVMVGENGSAAHFGTFSEGVQKQRENARVFFYTAEVYNRLVSFRIAWDEALQTGLKPADPGFATKLMKGADDYSFNMTRESASYWQKGILSIPTQFWAYNARMLDAMVGSRFTGKQKLSLIAMNAVLAGSAGNLATEGFSYFMKKSSGQTPPIDSLVGLADRGVVDRMAYELTGADVKIGEKIGTGGWARDVMSNLFGLGEYGERSTAEMLGGATAGITVSLGKTIADVIEYSAAETGGDTGRELTKDSVLKMAQQIATFNNISKASLAHGYQIFISNGGSVYPNIPSADAFFIAMGYRPSQIEKMSHQASYLKDKKDTIKEAAGQITKWRQEAFYVEDMYEENLIKVNTFVKLLPPDIKKEVLQAANSKKDNETFYDYIEEKYNREVQKEENIDANEEEGNQ